jgi:hypothetical protein
MSLEHREHIHTFFANPVDDAVRALKYFSHVLSAQLGYAPPCERQTCGHLGCTREAKLSGDP